MSTSRRFTAEEAAYILAEDELDDSADSVSSTSADESDDTYEEASTVSELDFESEIDTSSSSIISTVASRDIVRGSYRYRRGARGCGPRIRGGRTVSKTTHNAQSNNRKRKRTKPIEARYKWEKTSNPCHQFPFHSDPGLKIEMPEDASPIDFAKLFYTDELRQNLVQETNVYARKVIDALRPLRRTSALNQWKDVTLTEMDIFLGIIVFMGLVGMPSYRHYLEK